VIPVAFLLYLLLGSSPATAVDAPLLLHQPARRSPVHHAGRHLRHPGRRFVVADHPVHDLRRVPATLRSRQVLHRLFDADDGRQAQRRRRHWRAVGVSPSCAGRRVVLWSFLLGGPSGSGVATTVAIGAVAYPMMQRAGFEKKAAGGVRAAGGLGAIISPPVLGAAAFLIAEFLKISYLDVIWMAAIPTCLYY